MRAPVMDRVLGLLLLLYQCSGLEVTAPLSQTALFQSRVVLPCTFNVGSSPINPQFLAIIWSFGNTELLRFDNKEKVVMAGMSFNEVAALQGDAALTIRNVTIANHGAYKCLVIYSPDRMTKGIQLDVQATPLVKIQKKALLKNENNRVNCSITGFYPRAITVTWLRNNIPVLDRSEMGTSHKDDDGTFRLSSSIVLTPGQVQDRPTISCRVEHESLQQPIQDDFLVTYKVAPKVQLTASRTPDGNEQLYACEARGFSPEPLSINWLVDGKLANLSRGSGDGVFNKEIYYRVNLKENKIPAQISCNIQHEALNSPVTKTLEVQGYNECTRNCHFGVTAVSLVISLLAIGYLSWIYITMKTFQMSHIHKEHVPGNEEKVSLYCMASQCRGEVQVTWTIKAEGQNLIEIPNRQKCQDEESGPLINHEYTVKTEQKEINATSVLSFNPTRSSHKNTEVKCHFLCGRRHQERTLNFSFTHKKPIVKDPIQLSLDDSENVVCSLVLKNFYPRNIEIKWNCGNNQDLPSSPDITNDQDYTFQCHSTCRIPKNFLDPGFKIRVTWKHDSLDQPGNQELSSKDFPWRPKMADFKVPPLIHDTEAKLQCVIRGYFPNNLEVKWLRREAGKPELYEVFPGDKYKIPVLDVNQASNKTFTCTASLIVSPVSVKTEHKSEFICRVTHPSLEAPLDKKTGELTVRGIPTVTLKQESDAGKGLTAQISNFYPEKINITWSRSKKKSEQHYEEIEQKDYSVSKPSPQSDGAYTCDSWVSSSKTQSIMPHIKHHDNRRYKITVSHESVKSPIEKMFKHIKGGPFEEVPKEQSGGETTQEEMSSSKVGIQAEGIPTVTLKQESEAGKTLTAQISHFHSKEIKVTWSRTKGMSGQQFQPYEQKEFSVSKPSLQNDGTYSWISTKKISTKKQSIISKAKPHDDNKLYKITVSYDSVKPPIEKIFKRTKGGQFVEVTKEQSGEETAQEVMSSFEGANQAEGGQFVEVTKEQSGEQTAQAEMSSFEVANPAEGGKSEEVTKEQSGEETAQAETSSSKVGNEEEGGQIEKVTKEPSAEGTAQAEMSSFEVGNQEEGEDMLKQLDRKDSKKKKQNSIKRFFNS